MKLYQTLGVEPVATSDQIKQAYRSKAKTMHPDVGGDAETFNAITKAYDLLMDADRRAKYDANGDDSDAVLVDPIEQQAREIVFMMFTAMFKDFTISASSNPLWEILNKIDNANVAITKDIVQMNISLAHIKQTALRVKIKDATVIDLAAGVFAQAVRDTAEAIKKLERDKLVNVRARELISNYDIEGQKVQTTTWGRTSAT